LNLKVKGPNELGNYKVSGKVQVENGGSVPVLQGVLKVYLSEDGVFDETDALLVEKSFSKVKPGASKKVKFSTTTLLPTDREVLYFIAVVETEVGDSQPVVEEYHGGVDLTGQWVEIAVKLGSTGDYRVKGKFSVANNGGLGSRGFYVQVYYSEDDVLDADDTPMFETPKWVRKLKAGASKSVKVKHTFEQDPRGGYFILKVDIDDAVDETDEDNNVVPGQIVGE